jgi:hypothetical protein
MLRGAMIKSIPRGKSDSRRPSRRTFAVCIEELGYLLENERLEIWEAKDK